MEDESVVVVGAGLAGLIAARRLAAADFDVTVYERRDEVGGRVRSETRDGFTFDRGFQVLFTAYPMVRAELDLDALDLRYFKPGATLARPSRRSVLSDPLRDPGALLGSLRNPEVTTTDKLRTLALRQHVVSRREDEFFAGPDESIRDYLREWGFSRDYAEHFVAPFYGGITLDRSLSTSKHVFEYTFRALSEGRIAVPAEGMRAIPEQLADNARAAGANVRLGEAVEGIEDRGDGDAAGDAGGVTVTTSEETVEADAVVVAADPKRARELTGVDAIPTDARGCVTQHYRLPPGEGLDTGKRLLLNAGDNAVAPVGEDGEEPDSVADPADAVAPNTVVHANAVAPEYAPGDAELVNATFVGDDVQELSDGDLESATRRTLEAWYPDRSFEELDRLETHRVPFSQFDQPPGVFEDLPDVRDAGGRTYLAGDYTQWSSIQGAMLSGRRAAEAVVTDVSR